MLASSLPPTTASPATDDPLDGSRLIAETRALAAAYRRIIEEGSGEVLAVSGPTATFAFGPHPPRPGRLHPGRDSLG